MKDKEITDKIKEAFNDIILAKDIEKFRAFLEEHGEQLTTSIQKKLLTLSDRQVEDVMTFWSATQPVFAPYWELNRNILREKALEEDIDLATSDLKSYIENNAGDNPPCLECRWFRNAPFPEEVSCIQLGALPTDVACAGWTKIGDGDELSRSSENGSPKRIGHISAGRSSD